MTKFDPGRRLALAGAMLVLIGLVTGLISPSLANPRMGLSSHLAALGGGTLLLALGAAWGHVRLGARSEGWAVGLLVFGNYANWLATLLAAIWGAGRAMMPLAAGNHAATPMQENTIAVLLIVLSLAVIAGMALVVRGLLGPR